MYVCMYVYMYGEGEGKGEGTGGRETSMCERDIYQMPLTHPQLGTLPATQACALTGNQTGDPSVHRPTLHPLSHSSQGQ